MRLFILTDTSVCLIYNGSLQDRSYRHVVLWPCDFFVQLQFLVHSTTYDTFEFLLLTFTDSCWLCLKKVVSTFHFSEVENELPAKINISIQRICNVQILWIRLLRLEDLHRYCLHLLLHTKELICRDICCTRFSEPSARNFMFLNKFGILQDKGL